MTAYDTQALDELRRWQHEMQRAPGLWNRATSGVQRKINSYIPEKVHASVTAVIKQMTRAVLEGSNFTASAPLLEGSLEDRETRVRTTVDRYRKTAAVEGGITGAGGFLLGLADFPLLLSIKLKMLFEIAALYGFSGEDYRERLYLLHVFQLAFSSDAHRADVYQKMQHWHERTATLPGSIDDFDWRRFQQEYRDYIDLAKLAQLLPVIGAPVGVIVNNNLLKKLGITAMNAYRMRWFERPALIDASQP
ncbi:EcsC family protein [Peristeroidobacter agariperforans]|uniref:EcsC family protein n=1 Tax=Peristeroidobacter agariperforans TaxID=268404 RepID=UPI00101D8FF1|nr:EcsC family protein [Peristeroidobacter agariperforans]